MSTQPHFTPQWKEEVNRRLAAHKNRKVQQPGPEAEHPASGEGASRAAQAAARVAARYAKAPSFSQMQAEGARVAVRAAEIATQVALEAQAAAESALAELHAATHDRGPRGKVFVRGVEERGPGVVQPIAPLPRPEMEPVGEPAPVPVAVDELQLPFETSTEAAESAVPASPPPEAPVERRVLDIRWDPDMPVRPAERKPAARRAQEEFELATEDWWRPAEIGDSLRATPIEVGDDEAPHANLIHFPRELVATRKMRPRLGEATAARSDADGQLSIFEVDPATISTEAAVPGTEPGGAASTWPGMRLDSRPEEVLAAASRADPAFSFLPVAPLGLRLMATVVDCSLILAGFVSLGFLAVRHFPHPPTGKPAELLGFVALALIGLLYYAFFFAFPVSTPGMMYAGIGLCTFNDQSPTRAQLRRRLVAMVLSLLPVGLGLVWSLFDEDHLSWHDRFSQTYPRKS